MLGGADNPNGELLSYIIGADNSALYYLTYAQTSFGTLSYNLFIVNSARRWSAAELKASRSLSGKS